MGELRELVHRTFKAIDTGDLDTVEATISPDCEFVAPGFAGTGGAVATGFMRPFLDAFPDISHQVSNEVESDGAIAFELLIHGTHTEPLVGAGGAMPATGKQIALPAANIWRVADGKITSYHVHFDQMTLLGQLGMAPGAQA